MQKYQYAFVIVVSVLLLTMGFQNCGNEQANFTNIATKALHQDPFDDGPAAQALDDIASVDAVPYNTTETGIADCSDPDRYEYEKTLALQEAAADKSGQTIPVQYSYSFGDKHDILAKYANKRAVLSKANPGYSVVPVGTKSSASYHGKRLYYKANHDRAKSDILEGRRCYFSTINVDKNDIKTSDPKGFGFITDPVTDKQRHSIHYMIYGYCKAGRSDCTADKTYAGEFANRLFAPVTEAKDGPQIIKLYMADFRSEHFGPHPVIQVDSGVERGAERDMKVDDIMNVEVLHQNLDEIKMLLSQTLVVNNITFAPMTGVTQILHQFILIKHVGTVVSTQYTPLVLDLGKRGIRTSSVRWGTYFNLGALENLDLNKNNLDRYYVPHRTAWVGGYYKHFTKKDSNIADVRIIAEDGFLAIPDKDGKIRSSRNLFGENMIVNGKTHKNGFKALQALAGKSCQSNDIKKQYLGPWDGDLYHKTIKVWVDLDRNGVVNPSELKSLTDAGVLAVNACNIVHREATDRHGNGTALRSLFLMTGDKDSTAPSSDEILTRLTTLKTSSGEDANFRLVVDIIFKTNEDLLLINSINAGRVTQ